MMYDQKRRLVAALPEVKTEGWEERQDDSARYTLADILDAVQNADMSVGLETMLSKSDDPEAFRWAVEQNEYVAVTLFEHHAFPLDILQSVADSPEDYFDYHDAMDPEDWDGLREDLKSTFELRRQESSWDEARAIGEYPSYVAEWLNAGQTVQDVADAPWSVGLNFTDVDDADIKAVLLQLLSRDKVRQRLMIHSIPVDVRIWAVENLPDTPAALRFVEDCVIAASCTDTKFLYKKRRDPVRVFDAVIRSDMSRNRKVVAPYFTGRKVSQFAEQALTEALASGWAPGPRAEKILLSNFEMFDPWQLRTVIQSPGCGLATLKFITKGVSTEKLNSFDCDGPAQVCASLLAELQKHDGFEQVLPEVLDWPFWSDVFGYEEFCLAALARTEDIEPLGPVPTKALLPRRIQAVLLAHDRTTPAMWIQAFGNSGALADMLYDAFNGNEEDFTLACNLISDGHMAAAEAVATVEALR